jgi:DNA mismatch endonuclease (patch repair protein)
MRAVGTAHTGPEWIVRRLLHKNGYRYRLHAKRLPGRPDVVFPSRRKAIFVHGCFWHGHGCSKGRAPKSKLDYWGPKLDQNAARDRRNEDDLRRLGWETLTVWQCETKDEAELLARLKSFVDGSEIPIDNGSSIG